MYPHGGYSTKEIKLMYTKAAEEHYLLRILGFYQHNISSATDVMHGAHQIHLMCILGMYHPGNFSTLLDMTKTWNRLENRLANRLAYTGLSMDL